MRIVDKKTFVLKQMFFYTKLKTIATMIHMKLPANASLGRCQRDSLNLFSQIDSFIADA
jgi:hypothetical protein